MAILNRFTRLFKADVHAMLDQLEEPETLLKQAVRDMDEEVRKKQLQINSLQQQIGQNKARRDELSKIITEIHSQLDLCFAAENAELAKDLIRRKLENQRLISCLQRQCAPLEEQLRELQTLFRQQSQKLEIMRQQAAVFDAAPEPADSLLSSCNEIMGANGSIVVTDQEVEIAWLQEQKRRSR